VVATPASAKDPTAAPTAASTRAAVAVAAAARRVRRRGRPVPRRWLVRLPGGRVPQRDRRALPRRADRAPRLPQELRAVRPRPRRSWRPRVVRG